MVPVQPQDVVATYPHRSALSHPRPCCHVPVPPALIEVLEDFHQPELRQKVRDLLDMRVMSFENVGAEVPFQYGILVLEACQGLLQVR